MHKKQAKLVNAQSNLYEGTRKNSHVICAQTYTIKLFEFFIFRFTLVECFKKKKQKGVGRDIDTSICMYQNQHNY